MYNQSHYITMIKSTLYLFEKRNYKAEQIVKCISKLDIFLRIKIYNIALSSGKKELASEIKKANEIINQIQLQEFKKSVENGTSQEFLSNMSSEGKKIFRTYLHKKLEYPLNQQLTEQEQKYLDVINQAIIKDEEIEAKREGFTSIKEWEDFKERNEHWNPTTKIMPKSASSGTRFRDERIKIQSATRTPKTSQTQVVDINGRRMRLNMEEIKSIQQPKRSPSSGLNHIYSKDAKSYINPIIEDLSMNPNNFSKWRLQYIKFKALLSTKMISLTDVKRFAVALAYAQVKYTHEEQELEFRKEQSNLLSLISLINNPTEMQSRRISYINIDKAYQEIIESNSNSSEQRKR